MKTDSPFKFLLSSYAEQTASWLLNVPLERIRSVQNLNTEMSAQAVRADLLFNVELDDNTETILHIEVQGKGSDMHIPYRMLGYTANIVVQEKLKSGDNLCSVVIYVGKGAGANDNGDYKLSCPLGADSLSIHYHVIRLWNIEAETLLAMDNTALLALIGQTKIDKPRELIPKVVKKIRELVPTAEEQTRLFSLLAILAEGKDVSEMIETVLDELDIGWLDTPLAQRLRTLGKTEGITEGKAEGKAEGITEGINIGKAEGITEGITTGKTEGILEGLLDGLEVALDIKFGIEGLRLMADLRRIKDINILKVVRSMLKAVNSPEELRIVYAQSLNPK
jgi:predicted transposase/invertase (TIGR01784 family)